MTTEERRPIQRPETWNARASDYEHTTELSTGAFAAQLLEAAGVGAGTRLVDVAAGAGAVTMAAVERGAVVTAIDFSEGMLGRLRARTSERGMAVEALVMDGEKLEFADESFDGVCSNFGAVFFPNMTAGLREALRVLAPGGRVAITGWSQEGDGWREVLSEAWRRALPDVPVEMGTNRWQYVDAMGESLTEAGFEDVRVDVVQAVFETPSAQWMLENYATIQMPISRLPAEQRAKIDVTLAELLRERFGDGKPTFTLEANLGVGVKAM